MQIIPFEIDLREEKWLVASIYNAPSQNSADFYRTRYEKVIILGDFTIEAENSIRFTIWWNRIHVLMVTEIRAWIY